MDKIAWVGIPIRSRITKRRRTMEKKFVIFFNDELEPCIVLAIINYHKDIEFPIDFGKPLGRSGGGKWTVTNGVLRLYDLSGDFGKYDKDMAKESFNNKNIYYFDEPCYEDFKLESIHCD